MILSTMLLLLLRMLLLLPSSMLLLLLSDVANANVAPMLSICSPTPNPNLEESVAPPCFTHDLQDFVRGGIRAGFAVRDLSEWRDELINPELKGKPPRILCVIFEKK